MFTEDQPIKVTLRGHLPEHRITRQVTENLTNPVGETPHLLFCVPSAKVPLTEKLEAEFLEENNIFPNYLHATSLQRRAHGSFKQAGVKPLEWDYRCPRMSEESLMNFDDMLGETRKKGLNEDSLRRLRVSWAHLRLYSHNLISRLTEEIDGTELAETIRSNVNAGINQLYQHHLEVAHMLDDLTKPIADNADKMLLFLREKGDWVTKRQIQRRFTMKAGPRDQILKELTVRNLILESDRHVKTVSLNEALKRGLETP